jgi:hypothetical protein
MEEVVLYGTRAMVYKRKFSDVVGVCWKVERR